MARHKPGLFFRERILPLRLCRRFSSLRVYRPLRTETIRKGQRSMYQKIQISNPSIGVTERGDAGRMLSWGSKIKTDTQPHGVDMAVLITKCITQGFIDQVIALYRDGARLIVHCGCTGLGGSNIEPGSPVPRDQIASLKMLLDAGFPKEQCVLRIDPIIPNTYGLNAMRHVLRTADELIGLDGLRVRISVIDDYPHVKARFRAAGLEPIYPGRQFYADESQFKAVAGVCAEFPAVTFETCAEMSLDGPNILRRGCVSDTDLAICGIEAPPTQSVNPQNRAGCLCRSGKRDLLTCKHPCGSRCLYCYWKDAAPGA